LYREQKKQSSKQERLYSKFGCKASRRSRTASRRGVIVRRRACTTSSLSRKSRR
jgi:hypothetical protein